MGLALEFCLQAGNGLDEQLCEVMSRLFDVGSAVATPPGNSVGAAKLAHTRFGPRPCELLESWLDAHDAALPPLRAFILPSGGSAAAALHAARAVCRRAERAVVPLVRCGDVEEAVGAYLNRLSDYLFVAARTAVRCDALGCHGFALTPGIPGGQGWRGGDNLQEAG